MKGKHRVIVESDRVRYDFEIKRNITVVQGDSGTGKTSLLELLRQYSQRGEGSGIMLQSDKRCIVFGGASDNWKPVIESERDCIVFIDEDYSFIFSKDFAECIKHTDNYYVLISRRPLKELPYSTKEIYGIRTSGKYHFPMKVYNEFYPMYPDDHYENEGRTLLIIEDSNSGFQFFSKINGEDGCISAGGNTNIYRTLMELKEPRCPLTVIADGAAFGAFIEGVLSLATIRKDVSVYLPESFEWLVLKAGIIDAAGIRDILAMPENYIESTEYFSWERFFADLLCKATANEPIKSYSKTRLKPFYLQKRNVEKIVSLLPMELRKRLLSERG